MAFSMYTSGEALRSSSFEDESFQDICIIEENTTHATMFHTTYVDKAGCTHMGITTCKDKAIMMAIGLGFSGKKHHMLFKKGEGNLKPRDFVTLLNRKNSV